MNNGRDMKKILFGIVMLCGLAMEAYSFVAVESKALRSDATPTYTCRTYKSTGGQFLRIRYDRPEYLNPYDAYMTVIYTDNNEVYLKDFLNIFSNSFPDPHETRAQDWIKGKLSEDGRKIIIPAGSIYNKFYAGLLFDEIKEERIYPGVATFNEGSIESVLINKEIPDITFSISEDGIISPDNVDSTHGWLCSCPDYDVMVFSGTYIPEEHQPIMPPPGIKTSEYDLTFYTLASKGEIIGKRIRIAENGDSVYVQGFSYFSPEGWMAGKRDGDYVTFENNQKLAVNTNLRSESGNIIFKRDPITADYSLIPSETGTDRLKKAIWFTKKPDDPDFSDDYYEQDPELRGLYAICDWYSLPKMRKIPAGGQIPREPFIDISLEYRKIYVTGTYFDINGYVIWKDQLFFRVFINDKPYIFSKQKDKVMRNSDEPTTDLPFPNLAFCIDTPDSQDKYSFYIKSDEDIKSVRAEVINIANGEEYTSTISSHYMDEIEQREGCQMYDISGQKVNEEDLRPGIYIKDKKKIVVK